MGNATSIFLIEDDKHDQYFFKQALHNIECASLYDIANNGREALAKLRAADTLPDLIFTDIHMPEMDGIECLTEIIKIPVIRDIPVVVLSSDTTQIETLSKMGVKIFIEKPCDCTILQKLVEYVLDMEFMTTKSIAGPDFQFILAHTN